MTETKRILGVACLLLLTASCSGEDDFAFRLLVVDKPVTPTDTTRLNEPTSYCGLARNSRTGLGQTQYKLRITFMKRDSSGSAQLSDWDQHRRYQLVCDRVVAPGKDLQFQVPTSSGKELAMRVEAFNPKTNALMLAGQSESVDISSPDAEVYLRDAKTLSCVDPLSQSRAFHSATLLPNGQVLVLGGLVANTDGSSKILPTEQATEPAYVTASPELYDPKKLSFVKLSGGLSGRAFHRAHLLPSPVGGPYRVLVIGGIQPAKAGQAAFDLKVSSTTLPFLVNPTSGATAAPSGVVTFYPAVAGNSPRLEYKNSPALASIKSMFPNTYMVPGKKKLVVVGGGASYTQSGAGVTDPGFTAAGAHLIDVSQPTFSLSSVKLQDARVGHALTPVSPLRLLVLGGNMTWGCKDKVTCNTNVGELLTVEGNALKVTTVMFKPQHPTAMAWHALEALGSTDDQLAPLGSGTARAPAALALSGGYALTWEADALRVDNQKVDQTTALRRVSSGGSGTANISVVSDMGDYKATGYHQATRLADGRLLISGGNVRITTTRFSAVSTLLTYGLTGNVITPIKDLAAASKLMVPRFGHRVTRLLDQTLLITGGVTHLNGKAQLVDYSELLSPRLGNAAEDLFDRKPGQDYDTSRSASGHTCPDRQE